MATLLKTSVLSLVLLLSNKFKLVTLVKTIEKQPPLLFVCSSVIHFAFAFHQQKCLQTLPNDHFLLQQVRKHFSFLLTIKSVLPLASSTISIHFFLLSSFSNVFHALLIISNACCALSESSWFLSGCTKIENLLYFFFTSSSGVSGSTCNTSKGFKLKYVEPGRKSLSICCFGVNTESLFSISLTCKARVEKKNVCCGVVKRLPLCKTRWILLLLGVLSDCLPLRCWIARCFLKSWLFLFGCH